MSTSIMALCWPLQMPPSAKAVLVSLADNANDQGACWPSIATIMERTCLSERTIQAQLAWLEQHGAIERDMRGGRSTMYVVRPGNFKATPANVAPPQMPHPAADAPQPPQMPHPTPANAAPRTVSEPSIEPSVKESSRKRSPRTDSGTRLPEGWACPDEWADEAIAIQPTWGRNKAFLVADAFRDYWVAVPGAKGRKTDWLATWRNWVRREKPEQQRQQFQTVHDKRANTIAALTGRNQNERTATEPRDITGESSRVA